MLVLALLVVAALFALMFFGRLAGARRAAIAKHWPSVLLATAAIFTMLRGGIWLALALLVVSGIVFMLSSPAAPQTAPPQDEPADAEARALLGVGAEASPADIRAAYRAKMASAHPDRGGSHNEAARLTAARDRLLKRRR